MLSKVSFIMKINHTWLKVTAPAKTFCLQNLLKIYGGLQHSIWTRNSNCIPRYQYSLNACEDIYFKKILSDWENSDQQSILPSHTIIAVLHWNQNLNLTDIWTWHKIRVQVKLSSFQLISMTCNTLPNIVTLVPLKISLIHIQWTVFYHSLLNTVPTPHPYLQHTCNTGNVTFCISTASVLLN